MIRTAAALLIAFLLTACGIGSSDMAPPSDDPFADVPLFPGETEEMRLLINKYAQVHGIPAELLHKVIQRESDYRAGARNGPYWGLMQILPATARSMGFRGEPRDLLDAETNLRYATRYLRGAWLVSDGDMDEAVMWYARGYYYEAKRRGLVAETGVDGRKVWPS